jgi:NAD(P)-dependent dehydrogenase (short-subunit alcohol dehydrogenase family)
VPAVDARSLAAEADVPCVGSEPRSGGILGAARPHRRGHPLLGSSGLPTVGRSREEGDVTDWRPDPDALRGRVAVVAGATRGAGRGIALALGEAGATVVCSGRSSRTRSLRSDYDRPETIEETAELVTASGGRGIPAVVDHLDAGQVMRLAEQVRDAHGHIDILVNDIWGAEQLKGGPPDWNRPLWQLDLEKGLRILRLAVDTHLITSHHLLPLLVDRPGGLLVEVTDGTSDYNASRYRLSVFYDLAKAAVNRLAFSQGHELAPYQATAVAITPGWLRSEMMLESYGVTEADWRAAAAPPGFAVSESPRYVGRAVVALAIDPGRARWNQQSVTSGQLAAEYGFTDVDGSRPDVWRYARAVEDGARDVDPSDFR